jgi:hypothetical protein
MTMHDVRRLTWRDVVAMNEVLRDEARERRLAARKRGRK